MSFNIPSLLNTPIFTCTKGRGSQRGVQLNNGKHCGFEEEKEEEEKEEEEKEEE